VDNTQNPPFPVMETSAELLYLLKFADKEDKYGFKDELERNQCLQWLFFAHGSMAPYQGKRIPVSRPPVLRVSVSTSKHGRGAVLDVLLTQDHCAKEKDIKLRGLCGKTNPKLTPPPGQVNHFSRAAPEKIPYAITRFKNETLRTYGVLEIQLSGKYTGQEREYLAGHGKGKYSVADIKTWPWVKGWEKTGFTEEEMKEFPHLKKWIERIGGREAVKRGVGEGYNLKK
jgi:glutathione S-transferase